MTVAEDSIQNNLKNQLNYPTYTEVCHGDTDPKYSEKGDLECFLSAYSPNTYTPCEQT